VPNKINAASRVAAFLLQLRGQSSGQATFHVWATVLGVAGDDFTLRREVIKRLPLLSDQIERVQQGMTLLDFSTELFAPYLDSMFRWSNTFNLDSAWNGYAGNITNEWILALRWCSEVMPHEEERIGDEDISFWVSRIEELLASISAAGLPQEIQKVMNTHLQQLRDALRSYQLSGLQSIEQSLLQAEADLRRRANHFSSSIEEASGNTLENLAEIGQVLSEVYAAVTKADITRPQGTNDNPIQALPFFGHSVLRSA